MRKFRHGNDLAFGEASLELRCSSCAIRARAAMRFPFNSTGSTILAYLGLTRMLLAMATKITASLETRCRALHGHVAKGGAYGLVAARFTVENMT